jgi:hypothetical protein
VSLQAGGPDLEAWIRCLNAECMSCQRANHQCMLFPTEIEPPSELDPGIEPENRPAASRRGRSGPIADRFGINISGELPAACCCICLPAAAPAPSLHRRSHPRSNAYAAAASAHRCHHHPRIFRTSVAHRCTPLIRLPETACGALCRRGATATAATSWPCLAVLITHREVR